MHEQVVAAVKRVEETFGRVDILVNDAGYLGRFGPIVDSDPDDWWKVWNVNMRGTYQVTRAFLPLLIRCGGDKTVINVASTGAHTVAPLISAYAVSLPSFSSVSSSDHVLPWHM